MFNTIKSQNSRRGLLSATSLATITAVTMLAVSVPTASAQTSESGVAYEEIFVTARKVEESLQEVPISIAAYSADALEQRGIDNLTEIARATAGLSFENFGGGFGTPTIRGQSQSRLTNPVQNVASFYNGVYLQRGYMIDQSLLNIGQVEVLRGPQSAALGRNAFAGAITYSSKRAGDEPEFGIDVGVGEDEFASFKVEGAYPLIADILGITAGYSYAEYDGGHKNNHPLADASGALTQGNVGGYENEAFSIGANFTPIEGLEINANYLDNNSEQESPANYHLINGSFDTALGLLNCGGATVFGESSLFCGELSTTPVIAPSTSRGFVRPEGIIVDPRANQELDSEIISISADYEITDQLSVSYLYGSTESSFIGGASSTYDQFNGAGIVFNRFGVVIVPEDIFFSPSGNGIHESDSHEFRVNFEPSESITAFVGAYFSDTEDYNISSGNVFEPAQTTGALTDFPTFLDPKTSGDLLESEVESVFGFVSYDIGPFSLSAEGRYTEEEITDGVNTVDFDYFTPRLTAGYEINDSSRVYASFAQGTKVGGINGGSGFFDPTEQFFDEEENTTFEIGSRNELMGGDLVLNGTVFFIDGSDLQVSSAETIDPMDPMPPLVVPAITGNLGDSETFGLELEANWYPIDNLSVYGSYGYSDAEFDSGVIDQRVVEFGLCDDVVCNADGDIGGNTLPRAPESTLAAGFLWDKDLNADLAYFVGADLGYQSKQYGSALNTYTISDRTIVDASIGVRSGGFEAKLSADNLFDEKYVSNAFDITGGNSFAFTLRQVTPALGDRRLFKLTLSYDY